MDCGGVGLKLSGEVRLQQERWEKCQEAAVSHRRGHNERARFAGSLQSKYETDSAKYLSCVTPPSLNESEWCSCSGFSESMEHTEHIICPLILLLTRCLTSPSHTFYSLWHCGITSWLFCWIVQFGEGQTWFISQENSVFTFKWRKDTKLSASSLCNVQYNSSVIARCACVLEPICLVLLLSSQVWHWADQIRPAWRHQIVRAARM